MWSKWSLGFFFKFGVNILRIVKLEKKKPSILKILEQTALHNSGAAVGCGWDPDLENELFFGYNYLINSLLFVIGISIAVFCIID